MNKFHKIILPVAILGVMSSCAELDIVDMFSVDKPFDVEQAEALAAYGSLKSYYKAASEAAPDKYNPNFKLGCALSVDDYISRGVTYRLANANFDQITAGNAMKYASIVGDNGEMNFSKVEAFVEAAQEAGMSIYGHTLCWHEQQNTKWLNKLIADKKIEFDPNAVEPVEDKKQTYTGMSKFPFYVMEYEPQIINGILTSENPDSWHQYFVTDGLSFKAETEYLVTAKIRGSVAGSLNVKLGDWDKLSEKPLEFTDSWSEVTVKMGQVSSTGGFCVFQPGGYQGKLEIEWVKISHIEAPSVKQYTSVISGGDAESGPSQNIFGKENAGNPVACNIVANPAGAGKVFAVKIAPKSGDEWDDQFFITSSSSLSEGEMVRITFDYYCTDTRSVPSQAHAGPGDYNHWQFGGNIDCKPEWQHYDKTITLSAEHCGNGKGFKTMAFNLRTGDGAATIYFDNITMETVTEGSTLPLTPEEKAAVLEAEMERWIKGMMEATKGYVSTWDVVNEAISGGGNGAQGYELQHYNGQPSQFFWQDYLGDDFVRVPVKYARKYFVENGGKAEDLKLFINDYNLESDWDNNRKLESLINWIKRWESDGVTKIDGIGTQMHISLHLNSGTHESKKRHITRMFELMAKSGKLVRITELDMGLVDENGNDIQTKDVTSEQAKLMAEHYNWVVREYFRVIPVAQQYGICQWCLTDSPDGSGWRPNQPVGLWDLNLNRKYQYAGFADGLAGKEYKAAEK